jgi:hypothetical protein
VALDHTASELDMRIAAGRKKRQQELQELAKTHDRELREVLQASKTLQNKQHSALVVKQEEFESRR